MPNGYLSFAQLVHKNECAVYKISENGNKFGVVSVLEIFPGKIIILCFRCIGAEYIPEHIFTAWKIFQIFMYPHGPVSARGYFLSFDIQKFISGHIVG